MIISDTKPPVWQDELYESLRKHGITLFCYVPDAGHTIAINRSLNDPNATSVPLTTEEEGVALLAGAHLGDKRGVLLMQSSGVGNCINMLSLIAISIPSLRRSTQALENAFRKHTTPSRSKAWIASSVGSSFATSNDGNSTKFLSVGLMY